MTPPNAGVKSASHARLEAAEAPRPREPGTASRPVPLIPLSHIAGVDLAGGFKAQWKPVHRSPAYGLWISVVAGLMLLVPLLYLAVLAAVGYATWWHATAHWHWVTDLTRAGSSRASVRGGLLIAGVIYIGPLLAGLALLLILLRPALAGSGSRDQHFTIEPSEEPGLHAFVSALCRYIGAPEPRRIDIDSSVNASASFRRGMISLFSRGDYVLTIGAPLMSGLSLNQFAGVLTHEFAHFSQSTGMRASYIINSINLWLYRIACERSAGELMMSEFARTQPSGGAVVFAIIFRIGSWLTRMFFTALLYVAHAISCIMSRQMEFDADRHQARLVGAQQFTATWRRMMELQEGFSAAMGELSDYYRLNQLPDDLASMVQSSSRRLGSDAKLRIDRELEDPKTPLFSTHPATSSRIKAVEKAQESALFSIDLPATILFRSFEDVCRKASYAQYKHLLGGALFTVTLVPTQTLLKGYAQLEQHADALVSYLGFAPPDWRPLFLGVSKITPSDNPKETFQKLRAARTRAAQLAKPAAAAAAEYIKADLTILQCEQASAWFELNRGATPKKFALPGKGRTDIGHLKDQATEKAVTASAIVDEAGESALLRLSCALRILHTKGSESKIADAATLRARSSQLVAVMAVLRNALPLAREIRIGYGKGELIAPALEDKRGIDQVKSVIRPLSDHVRDRLDDARRTLGAVQYPFDNPTGQITLAHRVIGESPAWRDFEAIFGAAGTFVIRYPAECRLVLAELVSIALTVESALTQKSAASES